jgi:hypothetical protein
MGGRIRLYDTYLKNVQKGVFALHTDTLKMALLNNSYVPNSTSVSRQSLTTYVSGAVIYTIGAYFIALTSGVSDVGLPDFNVATGTVVIDGSVAWQSAGLAPPSVHEIFADVSASEITGAGYTAGGKTITGVTVTNVSHDGVVGMPVTAWISATIIATYAVIYKLGTVDGLVNPVIAYILLDETGAPATTDLGNFSVQFDAASPFSLGHN